MHRLSGQFIILLLGDPCWQHNCPLYYFVTPHCNQNIGGKNNHRLLLYDIVGTTFVRLTLLLPTTAMIASAAKQFTCLTIGRSLLPTRSPPSLRICVIHQCNQCIGSQTIWSFTIGRTLFEHSPPFYYFVSPQCNQRIALSKHFIAILLDVPLATRSAPLLFCYPALQSMLGCENHCYFIVGENILSTKWPSFLFP